MNITDILVTDSNTFHFVCACCLFHSSFENVFLCLPLVICLYKKKKGGCHHPLEIFEGYS